MVNALFLQVLTVLLLERYLPPGISYTIRMSPCGTAWNIGWLRTCKALDDFIMQDILYKYRTMPEDFTSNYSFRIQRHANGTYLTTIFLLTMLFRFRHRAHRAEPSVMLENILNRAACKVIVMHASQHTGDTIHEQYRRVLESSRFRWFQAFSRILQILNAVADTKPPGASTFSVCGSFAAYLFEINTYLGAYPKWTPNDIDIFISDAPTSSSHYQLVKAISEAITRVLQTSLTGDASILATIKRASKYGNLGLRCIGARNVRNILERQVESWKHRNRGGYEEALIHLENEMKAGKVMVGNRTYDVVTVYDLTWQRTCGELPILGNFVSILSKVRKVNIVILKHTEVTSTLDVLKGFDLNKCQVGFDLKHFTSFKNIEYVTTVAQSTPLHYTQCAFSVPYLPETMQPTTRNSIIKTAIKNQVARFGKYYERYPFEDNETA